LFSNLVAPNNRISFQFPRVMYGQEYHRLLGRKANGETTKKRNRERKGGREREREENGAERGESLKQLEAKSAVFFVRQGTMASASTVTMQRSPLLGETHSRAGSPAHINTRARALI